MGLFARITATDSTKISVHAFGAALREWSTGGPTRQDIIDSFGLAGADVTELDALKATYDALPVGNAAQLATKAAYLNRFEDVMLLCEAGKYTEQQAKNRLGF